MEPVKPGIYRHFKGGKYLVFWVSENTETKVKSVEYTSLYGPHAGEHANRTVENFTEEVDRPELNYKGPRFRSMEEFEKLIADLKLVLPKICSRTTSADPKGCDKNNPLWGHCAVVALLVQDLFGGDLLRGSLEGTPFSEMRSHYWNRLPEGTELDLSAPQFGENYPKNMQAEIRPRSYLMTNTHTQTRYELLRQRFQKNRPI